MISIFIISIFAQAAPTVPYIDKEYDDVVIEETKDTKVYLSDCSVEKTAVRYFGNRPICTQNLNCRRGEKSKTAIVEPIQVKTSIYCAITSANAGCKSKTWQKCMIDDSFPDGLDMKCSSDNPGSTKPGCPNVDSQSAVQKQEAAAK